MLRTNSDLLSILIRVPLVLISIVIHELSHGFAAYKIGDNTAKNAGRLTLNPVKHIDPMGALCMLFFYFGWAKPVPVNPYRFKNRKAGMVIVSLAGPVSNILFAFLVMIVHCVLFLSFPVGYTENWKMVISTLYYLNLSLAVFNLIPIPPLDGSKVLGAFLPQDKFRLLMEYERYGMFILIILIYFSNQIPIIGNILMFGVTHLDNGISLLVESIFSLFL